MDKLVLDAIAGIDIVSRARPCRSASRGAIPLVEALPIALIQHWIPEAKK